MESSPGRPPPPLPEQHHRDAEAVREFEHPVLLVVVATALRPGEDRVVVVHHHRPRLLLVEQLAVDRADPGDQAVRRGVPAQFLHVVAPVLACNDQRPVLLERPGVHELVDVLAGHPVTAGVAFLHRLGPVLVQGVGVAFVQLLQVGTDVVRIELLRRRRAPAAHRRLLDEDDRVALAHHVAGRHGDPAHDAVAVGGNDVLHLHRLDHRHLLTLPDLVVHRHIHRDDGALHGRTETDRPLGAHHLRGLRHGLRRRLFRLDARVVVEQRQRIGGVHARAGVAALAPVGHRLGSGDIARRAVRVRRGEFGHVLVDPPRVHARAHEVLVPQHVAQERQVGAHALEPEFRQGACRPADRRPEVRRGRVAHHLGEQRVERRARAVPRVAEAVRTHPGAARGVVGGDRAARRAHRTVLADRLHVDPGLDGVAARCERSRLPEADLVKGRAPGEPDLRLDQVHPGHFLRHRVLHLQPRVRLDEHEGSLGTVPGRVDQELERPEVRVALAPREAHRRVDDRRAQVLGQPRGRRDLDEFLVPPLHAALAFAEMGDAAVQVAQHLDLDMTRPREELLHVHVRHPEGGPRLGPAPLVGRFEFVGGRHHARTATAAPRDGLHDHRPAGQGREEIPGLPQRNGPVDPVEHRYARPGRRRPGAALVAEQFEVFGTRSHEDDACFRAAAREAGAFRQEAVAGVDGPAARCPRRLDHALFVEIRCRPHALQGPGFVSRPHMQARGVVLRVHRHGPQAEFPRGPRDTDGDLAAVGDEQCIESHGLPSVVFLGRRNACPSTAPATAQSSARPGS